MRSRHFDLLILFASIVFVVYHLFLPVYAFLPSIRERSVHLGLAILIIFLGGKKSGGRLKTGFDICIVALGMGICTYVFVKYFDIIEQYGIAEGPLQVIMGIVLVLIILEMARRAVRPTLPMIALIFLLYLFFGHFIPGTYGHPQYSLKTIISSLFLTTGGVWGQLLGVSSNIIAIFVFLGAFIVSSGGGTGFMKISMRVAGRYGGGPAKVSAVSSALFGSISGSASANVASTGSFTIPMMKRLGYKPELAAGVEAVASTGGQIMPPIMGAGAFVMAELTQIPYLTIAAAAFLPACLYFSAVSLGIHFFSGKTGYKGLANTELPGWKETLTSSLFFIIPFAILLYWLIQKYTPQYAAFWALLSTLILTVFDTRWRLDFKSLWPKYREAIVTGARQASVIAAICACAQIIISVIAVTGVGIKFTNSMLSITGSSLFPSLVLIGLASILLGMEVPTTAAYIVAIVVGGPVLTDLGIPALAAHLFVFYLAILSAITPPICGAVFIAAGMAEADWVGTVKFSLKLGFAAFLLPFLFVYQPSLILIGSPLATVFTTLKGVLALAFFSAGFIGYLNADLNKSKRALILFSGCLMLTPFMLLNLTGLVFVIIIWFSGKTAAT